MSIQDQINKIKTDLSDTLAIVEKMKAEIDQLESKKDYGPDWLELPFGVVKKSDKVDVGVQEECDIALARRLCDYRKGDNSPYIASNGFPWKDATYIPGHRYERHPDDDKPPVWDGPIVVEFEDGTVLNRKSVSCGNNWGITVAFYPLQNKESK